MGSYDFIGVCIRNCAQCKKMFGSYFEGQMCADACVKFKGKIIPDCEDIGSIAPFLTKLDWNPGRFWNNGLLHTVPSRVSQHSLRFYLFRSRSSQWWISHGSRFFHSYDMHKKFLWKCPLKDTKSSYFIPTNPHCVGIYIYFFIIFFSVRLYDQHDCQILYNK